MKTLRHILLCLDKHPHFALAASKWRNRTFKSMLYTTLAELLKAEADRAPRFSLNNACALPFPMQHPCSFENWSQFLWTIATLTGGNRANPCSEPKLRSPAATTAQENQSACVRDLSPSVNTKTHCDKTFVCMCRGFFSLPTHCRNIISIIRTVPSLERHVLLSLMAGGLSNGTWLCRPQGHRGRAASCADGHARSPAACGPFALGSRQSRRKQGFLPPSYGDKNLPLWTHEGLLNRRSEVSWALSVAPPIFSCMDLGTLFDCSLSKLVKTTSERVLVWLIHWQL